MYGSIIILMWALGELNASYTFIVAWFKTDQRIIEAGYISYRDYFFKILLKTPEAVAALKQLAVLCLGAVMGMLGIFFRKRRISIPMMITAAILATFEVAEPFWMRLTDYTRYVKLAGCALIVIGSVCKLSVRAARNLKYGRKFDRLEEKKRRQAMSGRRDKTLIPERTAIKRVRGER